MLCRNTAGMAAGCMKEARPTATGVDPDDRSVGKQTCPKHHKTEAGEKFAIYLRTWSVTVVVFISSGLFFFGIMVFRMFLRMTIAASSSLPTAVLQYAPLIAVVAASALDVVAIVSMDGIFRVVAKKLTDYENHRTQEKYEGYLYTKVFAFEFVNYNATLFYLGFIKGRFYGYPGNYGSFEENDDQYRMESCPPYGCQMDVTIQLVMIFVVKSWAQNIGETFVPKVMNCISRFNMPNWMKTVCCCCYGTDYFKATCTTLGCGCDVAKAKEDEINLDAKLAKRAKDLEEMPWENNFTRLAEAPKEYELFNDYQELVMQFGFLSLFITSCPIAPFFALLINVRWSFLTTFLRSRMLSDPTPVAWLEACTHVI
jgi:hypothetical protein